MLVSAWPKEGCILVVHRNFSFAHSKAFEYAEQRLSGESTVASGETTMGNKPVGAGIKAGPVPLHRALIKAGTHPDFRYLEPGEGSERITLEPIRDLIDWVAHKPLLSDHRVAVFSAAEALNHQAANALLKTLEESSAQSTFLLLTHQPTLILATLRSRCYRVDLQTLETEEATLLAQVPLMQTDLKALCEANQDPITLAKQWTKTHTLKEILDIFWHLLAASFEFSNDRMAPSSGPYNKASRATPQHKIWYLIDKVVEAKKSLTEGAVVNDFLVLGSLWIEYTAIMGK